MIRIHLRHFSKKSFGFRNTVDHPVVPAVNPCLAFQVITAAKNIHHFHRKIKLCSTWLSSGHVKGKSLCLYLCKLSVQLFFQCLQFFLVHFGIFLHNFLLLPVFQGILPLPVYLLHFSMLNYWLSSLFPIQYLYGVCTFFVYSNHKDHLYPSFCLAQPSLFHYTVLIRHTCHQRKFKKNEVLFHVDCR